MRSAHTSSASADCPPDIPHSDGDDTNIKLLLMVSWWPPSFSYIRCILFGIDRIRPRASLASKRFSSFETSVQSSFKFLSLSLSFSLYLSLSSLISYSPCLLLVDTNACVVERRTECERASVRPVRSWSSYATPVRSRELLASSSAPDPPPPSLLLLGDDRTVMLPC